MLAGSGSPRHRLLPALRPDGRRPARDAGAVAVEFALLLPILILFLFGIIQYGYGLFQLQAFNAAVSDASRLAATGITGCDTFNTTLKSLVSGDGVSLANFDSATVAFQDPAGAPTSQAELGGLVKLTATFTPFKIGIPGIPFPSTITRSQTVPIQDVGLSSIINCNYTKP